MTKMWNGKPVPSLAEQDELAASRPISYFFQKGGLLFVGRELDEISFERYGALGNGLVATVNVDGETVYVTDALIRKYDALTRPQ